MAMASGRGRRGEDRAAKLTVDAWKRVLTDHQEQIVAKVSWNNPLIETFKNRVLSKDEVSIIKSQRTKNRGYRTLTSLKLKEKHHFLEFMKILNAQGYKALADKLDCAYKATQNVEPDIKEDVDSLVRVTCRTTHRADPSQVELQHKFGEMLQAQRLLWQRRTQELENKLELLQRDLDDICTNLLDTVSSDTRNDVKGSAVERMKTYTTALTGIIHNLQHENAKLAQESTHLKDEQDSLHQKVYSLEHLKRRQKEDLKHTRQKLVETTRALDRLQEEMERRDQEKATEIAALKSRIQQKDQDLENIITDHTEQMQAIASQIIKMEDDQNVLNENNVQQQQRIETLEAWQYEQYQRNAAVDAKLAEITGKMSVNEIESPMRSNSVMLPRRSHDRSGLPPVNKHRECLTHGQKKRN